MLAKQSKSVVDNQIDLLECGFPDGDCLWEEKDRLAVREVIVVDHEIEKKSHSTKIRLIVVKGCYLILFYIKVTEGKNTSLQVIEKEIFGSGPSNVVTVESIDNNSKQKSFMVACREGPIHVLTLGPEGVKSAKFLAVEICELFSRGFEGSNLDTRNYRCHGLKKSRNSSIWVFLQNGLLDEQVKFSKGKLTFLTQQSFSSLSKTLFDKSQDASVLGIPSNKDNLEIYRILAWNEHKSSTNHNPSNQILLELIKKDIKSNASNGSSHKETLQLYLWVCQLFATLSSDEIRPSWDTLADELHGKILCIHAFQILQMYQASDTRLNAKIYDDIAISSLKTFYLSFWDGEKKSIKDMSVSNYRWYCKFCSKHGTPITKEQKAQTEQAYLDCFSCAEQNHKWPRCILTMKICDEKNLLKCRWCESVALNLPGLLYLTVNCTICSGPLE